MPPGRPWLKFMLVLTLGFLAGVLLGMLSTTMILWLIPAPVIEQAIRERRESHLRREKLQNECG
ncbi:hypothetical protein LTS18_002517, partial [Coniosporium uncinatum]